MRNLFCFVIITIMLMTNSVCLYAADEEQTAGYTYSIDMFSWEMKYNNGTMYRDAHEVKGTIRCAYKIVAYREISFGSTVVKFYFYDSSGKIVYECNQFLENMRSYVSWSGTCESGKTDLLGVFKQDDEYSLSNNLRGTCCWKEDDYMNPDTVGRFVTSIPIFNSSEEAKKFISGELTEKDAINYESDLCNIVFDLEVPQNLKVEFDLVGIFRDPEYCFNWEQIDQNYTKWDTEIYVYGDFYGYDSVLGIPIGDDYVFEEEYIYKETIDTYKLRYVIAPETYIYEKGYDAVIERLLELEMNGTFSVEAYHVYIRNAYFDGAEQHYSNWVYVSFDHDFSGVNDLVVIEVEGSVEDTPGNVGTGTGTGINGNINNDSQYDGSVDVNWDESNDDIFTWISNGFGLGGDNGVITLLSDTFSFIPSELWAVFMSGIALMVLISVVKWVRG